MLSDLRAVLEQLTDENNDQPIELINDRGEKATFEQVALFPVTTASEEFEDETVEHHLALLQPLDENGEETGDYLVFDFKQDESGEVTVEMIDDPYVMRKVFELYRQRGNLLKEDEESEPESCDSIFGGTLTEEASECDDSDDAMIVEKEIELQKMVSPDKKEKSKKKGFFSKLFGK